MMDRGTELALKRAVREGLATRLQGDFDPVEVESAIQSLVQEAVRAWNLGLAEPDVARLCRSVGDDFLRYGPLQGLLEDPGITEIIVNGGGVAMDAGVARFLEPHVFVERAGRLEPCPYVRFDDADHLRRIIDKIAEQAGMRCDEAHAMGCAMLPGGKARATYIVPPLAPDGPALNLRLFGDDVMSIEDLTARGALSPVMAEFLGSAVRARCPVIISGGTGSGKTTMLGALSGFIPDDERVLTIEDTPELRLRAAHVERMQTREANTEGEGAVGMRELVALSLRRRPDRIIVGECRGAEAYEMLQAMQTDHPGSMTTVHANDPGNALSRLRTMVGYANADLGRDVIVQQIAESLAGGGVDRPCGAHARRRAARYQHRGGRPDARGCNGHPSRRAVPVRAARHGRVQPHHGSLARMRRPAAAHQAAHARGRGEVRSIMVFRVVGRRWL